MSTSSPATADNRYTLLIPALFVVLWSSGFIAAKVGVRDAEPLTFLTMRFALVAVLMVSIALAMRAPWPQSRREFGHIAVTGVFMQAGYFGGAWVSMAMGVGAGVSALIVCLQPILTAIVAGPLLGERVGPRQWLGLALGFGGVAMVVAKKLELGFGTPMAMGWSFVALICITVGTLYQKRFCPHMDPRTGGTIQFVMGIVVLAPLALIFEDQSINWTTDFVLALLYVAIFLSLISITLLTIMIRHGQASRLTSLFFLVPPTATAMAWIMLGETLTPIGIAGMVLTVIGVALVMLPGRRAA
ncbi:MAG: DMT family transporter [Pseudomonadota bacterium]